MKKATAILLGIAVAIVIAESAILSMYILANRPASRAGWKGEQAITPGSETMGSQQPVNPNRVATSDGKQRSLATATTQYADGWQEYRFEDLGFRLMLPELIYSPRIHVGRDPGSENEFWVDIIGNGTIRTKDGITIEFTIKEMNTDLPGWCEQLKGRNCSWIDGLLFGWVRNEDGTREHIQYEISKRYPVWMTEGRVEYNEAWDNYGFYENLTIKVEKKFYKIRISMGNAVKEDALKAAKTWRIIRDSFHAW